MPFKSKAQQRAMNAKAARGEISKKVVEELNRASRGKMRGKPEHVRKDMDDEPMRKHKRSMSD